MPKTALRSTVVSTIELSVFVSPGSGGPNPGRTPRIRIPQPRVSPNPGGATLGGTIGATVVPPAVMYTVVIVGGVIIVIEIRGIIFYNVAYYNSATVYSGTTQQQLINQGIDPATAAAMAQAQLAAYQQSAMGTAGYWHYFYQTYFNWGSLKLRPHVLSSAGEYK